MKWWLFLSFIISFNASEPSVSWSYEEHPTLSWMDFRGIPPRNAIHAASVNSGMSYSFTNEIVEGKPLFNITIQSHFYPDLSWKKDLNEESLPLLAHEQLHWDITQLHVMKLRYAFTKYRPVKNVKKEVAFIFNKFEKERAAMQARYDRETRHGTLKEPQAEWEIFIAGELFKVPQ
jgi:hypothetical protein